MGGMGRPGTGGGAEASEEAVGGERRGQVKRAVPEAGGGAEADAAVRWIEGASDGPLLLCVGGLHGNEPAGVRALEEVAGRLAGQSGKMAGDFVAAVGNIAALEAGRRFLAYDLNRVWTRSRLAARRGRSAPEDRETARLARLLKQVQERRRGPVYVLDIHTTSSGGGAFTTTAGLPANRRFAQVIPVPLVLGLGKHVEGTLITHLDQFGWTTAVFECGQHEEAAARARAAAAVWLAVRAAGLLREEDVPEAARGFLTLQADGRGLPPVMEMTHRHAVTESDAYQSRPGLRNFQPVRAGDIVGNDRRGDVAAPVDGRLLMPLYQEQGEDGFFVVEVKEGEGGGAPRVAGAAVETARAMVEAAGGVVETAEAVAGPRKTD